MFTKHKVYTGFVRARKVLLSFLFFLISTIFVPSGALAQLVPSGTLAQSGPFSTWHSHDPDVCLDQIFDYYYLTAITDAWIIRGDATEGKRLLQEYADLQRCKTDLGMVAATYTYIPKEEPHSTSTISAGEELLVSKKSLESEVTFDMKIDQTITKESFIEDFKGRREIRDDNSQSIEAGNLGGAPHICIGNVMVWQNNTQWAAGQWNARHRGTCIGSVVGRLRFVLKGDYVEGTETEDIYRIKYKINAPNGARWDMSRKFGLTPKNVIRWSPKSIYVIEVTGGGTSKQAQSLSTRPVNLKGREYPKISSQGRSPVHFPDIPPTFKGKKTAPHPDTWDRTCRKYYSKQKWSFPENLIPVSYQNHHIRPLRWNGRNKGKNCYRLTANAHYFFTVWWAEGNFRTPKAN